MIRDLVWILLAVCGVVVIPIVLLYSGLIGLMGFTYARHTGDWSGFLAIVGVYFGGPLVLGLIVYRFLKRPAHLSGDNRICVSSRRIQLPHEKYEREHGRPTNKSVKAVF